MTATLNDVTPRKKKPEPSAEEQAAAELVRLAREQGLSLTGPDGLLKQLTKTVLETALNEEMTEHLGNEKHVARLPLEQPDIVVGPVLNVADQRVVMLGRTHPLAGRADLSIEDLADRDVRRPYGLTAEQAEATCPARTPSGRPIRFVDAPVDDNAELLSLLARGRLVHPTVAPFAEHFQHPDVVAIPLRDLPPSTCALARLRDVVDPNRDALLDIVEQLSTS